MFKKRGQGLPMSTVVVAILVLVVLVIVIAILLGGTGKVSIKMKEVFQGSTAGEDKTVAINNCNQYCAQASQLGKDQLDSSAFCANAFYIDTDLDGEADFERRGEDKIYTRFYCNSYAAKGVQAEQEKFELGGKNEHLGVGCQYIVQDSCQPTA